jgi:hypothetical protein
MLIVDPQQRSVSWLALTNGEYREISRSRLIELGPDELRQRLDWPDIAESTTLLPGGA